MQPTRQTLMRTPEEKRLNSKKDKTVAQMQFPSDIGTHSMVLLFKEYSYANTTKSNAEQTIKESIMLPLPEQLLETSSFKGGATELGLLGAAAREAGSKASDSFGNATTGADAMNAISKELRENINTNDLKKVGTMAFAAAIKEAAQAFGLSGAVQGAQIGAGYTVNPYAAVSFEGVNLRTYVFDWTLAPRTRSETTAIKSIVNTIKMAIHPEYKGFGEGDKTFLKFPNVLHIKINGQPDPITFKPCMVNQFTANYVGAGDHAYLEGGDPAVWKLSMSVSEMEIWSREDYNLSNYYNAPIMPGLDGTT